VPKGPPSPQTSNRRVPSTRSVLERRRTSAIPGPQNTTRSVREELRTQGLNPQQIETVIQQVGSTVGEAGQTQQNTKPVQMEMGSRITSLNTSRQGIREYERRVSQPDNIAARREETNKSLRRRRPTVEAEKHASRPVDLGHKAASREASRASQPATPEKRKVKGAHVRTDTGSIFIRGLDLDDDEDDDEELEKGSPRKKIKSSEQALREAKVIIRKEQADEKRAAEKEAFEATLFPAHAPPPKLFAAPRDLREQGFEETSRGQKGQVHRSFDPSLTNPIDRHQRTINRTDMVGNWGPERKPLSWEERLEFQRNRDAQRSRQPAPQHVDNNPGPASISTGHQAISTTHTTEHGVAAAHHQGPGGSRDSGNHQASQGPHADLSIQLPRDSRSSRALLSHREPRTPQQQGPISNIARAPRLSGRPQPDMFANQEDENRLLPDSPPSAHRHPIHPLQRIQQQLRTSAGIRDTRPVGRTQTPNTNASARQDNQTRPTLLSPPRFVSGSTWPGQGLQERGERGTRGRGDTRNTRMRAATEQSQAQAQAQAQAQMRFGPSAAPPLAPPRGPGGVQIVSPQPVSPSVPAPTPKADWKVSKWMAEYQAEAEHDPLSRFYEK